MPIRHTRWLNNQIVSSRMEVESEAAPFSAIEKLPEALAWVVEHAVI